ncbi:lysozyme inhibitor LprI family protein [Niallia sp. JL1B1071]|uniref:lysozyme inhibitor LprI family protein n=1 Tax=Niallia tiangongensis TaxID=3237105 RepID=UPI0037DDB33B
MKTCKTCMAAILLVILLMGMSACSNSSNETTSSNNQTEPENIEESTDNASENIADPTPSDQNESDEAANNNNDSKLENNIEEKRQESLASIQKELDALPDKIAGNKQVFLERLDNLQKELDTLPDKEGSDSGATNAMKNYYGISYEKYDEALNAIYATLKKDLSSETMQDLQTKQLKWIDQKEAKAEEERLKYNGGTFEYVALYISLYESTKERCYVLVNEYMTD